MDSTFDTTNQREGEVGSVRSLIRKWRDTVSEAANGRQGGWIPSPHPTVGAAAQTVPIPGSGSASMEQADVPR